MSRSHKAPYYTQGYKGMARKSSKREANKTIRHAEDVPSGRAYRKFFNPWDICDWKFYTPRDPKASRK